MSENENGSRRASDVFKSFLFDGVVLILVGFVLLLWPDKTMNVIFMILGAIMGLVGLVKVIGFFTQKDPEKRNNVSLLIGILQLAFGITMVVAANFFKEMFYIAIGVIVVYGCILMAIELFRLRKSDPTRYYGAMVFGILLLAFAVIVFLRPQAFASFVTRLHGAALIVEGIALIFVMSGREKGPRELKKKK